MVRRLALGVCVLVVIVWALGSSAPSAQTAPPQTAGPPAPLSGPIKLARHPDYHAGKIAFSYLGDIWMANEDGSSPAPHRQHRARDVSAVLARRTMDRVLVESLRQQRRLRRSRPAAARRRRLTFHSGGDDVVGWTRDGAAVIFRSARGDGAFPNVATLYQNRRRRRA